MSSARAHRDLTLTGLALVLLCSSPAAGRPQEPGEAATRADIAFARGLATRFRYVDFAEEVIRGLESRGISAGLKEELDLAKCDIYAEGARRELDPKRRVALYEKAIGAYRSYVSAHPFSPLRAQAERSHVDLASAYGRVLALELEAAEGAEAAALRAEIRGVVEAALQRTGELLAELGGPALTESQRLERYRLLLNRGQMLLTLAGTTAEDATFDQAEETLEQLALEAGEKTGWGLNAFLFLAQLEQAQGDYAAAAEFSAFVLDTALPRDPAALAALGWEALPPEQKARSWALAELAAAAVIEANLSLGELRAACAWALHYYGLWKREGFELSPKGHLSLLACARALLDAGGWVGGSIQHGSALQWFEDDEAATAAGFTGERHGRPALDLALSIAQAVNEQNRGNTLQVRAQQLISDVIERPGVVVAPGVLFEAAQGEYFAGDYRKAEEAFKRVLRSLDTRDDASRSEFGAKALWHLGSALDRQGRSLEAAMAFREGCTTWPGDPEYAARNAAGYYDAIKLVLKNAPADPALQALRQQAEDLRIRLDTRGDRSELVLKQGIRAYDAQDHAGARALFLSVEKGGSAYEECLVRAALCLYRQKDGAAAEREFADYADRFVKDPASAVTDPAQRAARQKALAMATFYLGRIAFDESRWDGALARLDGYHEAFPAQTDYGPAALHMVVQARLARGELEAAMEAHGQLLQGFAASGFAGRSAEAIFEALALLQAQAQAAGEPERARALKQQMAEYRRAANSLATTLSYASHRLETKLWLELGLWTEAERSLRRLIELFSKDPERAGDVESHVQPDLAGCLLAQHRVPEAFQLLDPLVPDPGDAADARRVSAAVVRSWCRAVSGWVEGDAQSLVEVPGVGGGENLARAVLQWHRLISAEAVEGKWECAWYELKFELAYAYQQWSQADSSKRELAERVLFELRQLADDPEFDAVASRCGDDVLKTRFQWLWQQVR